MDNDREEILEAEIESLLDRIHSMRRAIADLCYPEYPYPDELDNVSLMELIVRRECPNAFEGIFRSPNEVSRSRAVVQGLKLLIASVEKPK